MKNPNSNKLQPSLSTQTCPLNLIMPQAMHYNEHVISDTKNLTTNTADIPHWAKIAQYQTACFGSNSLGAGACLTYPTRAGVSQPGPADAGRAEPRSGSRGSAPRTAPHPRLREENARPEEGGGGPCPGPGGVIQSTQQEPRGAGDKGSGGVWEVSFRPGIISHKLCQLSTVKQILEISTFPIWRERQHQLPLVLLSWELPQSARGDCLGFF